MRDHPENAGSDRTPAQDQLPPGVSAEQAAYWGHVVAGMRPMTEEEILAVGTILRRIDLRRSERLRPD